jgi:glycosyltransferase involved in cell wall biosynthesis
MDHLVTICIPCAPHHRELVQHAVDSAYAQSIPCAVRVFFDDQQYGAGYSRNRLLEQVSSPFVTFLDGDDTLEPGFVAECLQAYKPGRYVYTDWYEDGRPQTAPACDEWITDGVSRMHLVTTLLPMGMLKIVKGFDEHLPGIEDTDLYLRLRTRGFCGQRVAKPLLHYSSAGTRSQTFRQRADRQVIREQVWARYRGGIVSCNCGTTPTPTVGNERQDGDVLALALFPPRSEYGTVTSRYYRPKFSGEKLWAARADVQARPDLWQLIEDPEAATPDVDFVAALMSEALNA